MKKRTTMIGLIKKSNRSKEVIFLLSMSLFCLALSVFRFVYTGNKMFLFLNWNLFLAFIPWFAGICLRLKPEAKQRKGMIVAFVLLWLAFFPNAPYILTDLFHLRRQSAVPIWFDLTLILSFAWTGLLFGFFSLMDVQYTLQRFLPEKRVALVSVALLFISGFGIYLGRYLRWNSWDIVQQPLALLADISSRFTDPAHHPRTWGMTFFLGLLLNVMFYSFKIIRSRPL